MPISPGARLGRYEIRSKIGAGGMGEVYRARDEKLNRDVAIKVLPAELSQNADRLRRFEQEAQAAGALNHPNILAVYDVGTHDDAPYVVSELLEGESLKERLDDGPIAQRKATDYALQVAHGLAAAHEKGIVHRDLKPDNLFITKDDRVKILDFGIAKLIEPVSEGIAQTDIATRKVRTDPGTVMGTVGYMSPEQVRGRNVDHRSDIFSFGAVLYEMLSGKRAFHGDSAVETLNAILKEEPPELTKTNPNIAPALERVIWHCLEKSPERRFQSASDLGFALEALSTPSSSGLETAKVMTAETDGRAVAVRTWFFRNAMLAWLAAALFLASTLALAALYFRRAEPRAETMRFTLAAPEHATYGDSLALSPDGRQLAFVVTGGSGDTTLWVRALDVVSAQELPGTEGGAFPFWSPDSRFIGFFAQGKLKKIEATGGPVQTLADASADPRGGAWSPDGTILFAPNILLPLFKVPAAGGVASPVTELDKTREQTSHRWPWFLPDGRHFIYFAVGNQKDAEGIYVGSLDTKEVKFLLNSKLRAAYASSAPGASGATGYLLFVRDRTLVAQSFDPSKLQLSGEPFTIAEGVLNYPTGVGPTAYAAFSVSTNGHLSYLSGNAPVTQLAWLDRTGKLLGPIAAPGIYREPWLSPDGKRIVAGSGDTAEQDLWLLDSARGTTTRFTFDPASDVSAVWSPDGSHIAFASNRGGKHELYQKISSGAGSDELLLHTEGNAYPDDWSLDGRFILYELDGGPKTKYDLWVLPLAGERKPFPFLQTEFTETHAQFSPDGRWVAYASDESGRAEVYVQSFPASGGKWQVSTSGGDQPHWRRDGKELFYLAPDKRLMAGPVAAGASFEAGAPVALFPTRVPRADLTGDRNHFAVTPDGQRFLVNNLLEEGNTQPITLVLNWASALKH